MDIEPLLNTPEMRRLQESKLPPALRFFYDHVPFDRVGVPAFQFIQDPLDYGNFTHHTNQDVYEHLIPDDMKFNAAVVASFVWQAAQRDQMLPRPPEPEATNRH